MEWGDIILVTVSGSVGVVGAVVGAMVNSHFSQRQMKEIWAEEERRGKLDRRRELYERELAIVSDAVDHIVDMKSRVGGLASAGEAKGSEWAAKLTRSVGLAVDRAHVIVVSLEDGELTNRFAELLIGLANWGSLVDPGTGEAIGGKEKEMEELAVQTVSAASDVRRRIREILEEV